MDTFTITYVNFLQDSVQKPSTVANIVNLVRPTTIQFIALCVHLCRTKLTTLTTVDMPWQNLSKSRVWDKVPDGSTFILKLPKYFF